MSEDQFHNLSTGDIVAPIGGGSPAIISGNYGGRATAVQTFDITDPTRWELVLKADHSTPEREKMTDALEAERVPVGEGKRNRRREDG